MGYADRDYFRDSGRPTGGGFFNFGWTPVVKGLIIANIVVFVLQLLITVPTGTSMVETAEGEMIEVEGPRESLVTKWLAVDGQLILKGQIWRLITGAFCHSTLSVFHIVFNMLFLFWFGVRLEQKYGPREFLYFYFAAAIFASVCFIVLDLITGLNARAIGASGAVLGVVMLFALWWPREKILLFFVLPIEIRWVALMFIVSDLFPVLSQLGGNPVPDGVAHAAHLGGLAFAMLYFYRPFRLEDRLGSLGGLVKNSEDKRRVADKRAFAERKAAVENDKKVDEILEKVHNEGLHSLTPEEREILMRDSEKRRGK